MLLDLTGLLSAQGEVGKGRAHQLDGLPLPSTVVASQSIIITYLFK